MKKTTIIALLLLAILSCNNRNGPVNPGNNGCGSEFDNESPSISGAVEDLWYDYDHATGQGAVRLIFSVDDPNLPCDSYVYRIFIATGTPIMRQLIPENDSICILDHLQRNATYRCSLWVADSLNSTASTIVTVSLPSLSPPSPPHLTLAIDDGSPVITWNAVAEATGYRIYSAQQRAGPYPSDTLIAQPSAGEGTPLTFRDNRLDERTFRFYIISSVNDAGECRSGDTLFGRIFSDRIAVPSIDSVSRGTYPDHIRISWHVDDTAVSRFEIYRASGENGPYTLLTVVNAMPSANFLNDSSPTTAPRYYKIGAVDAAGRSGRLSASGYGYRYSATMSAVVRVQGFFDHVGVYWNSIAGAHEYAVYRSSTGCMSAMTRIAATDSLMYRDSVNSIATHYYVVATVDTAGREVAVSNCAAGGRCKLPAPKGILADASGIAAISLSWDSLPGAAGYIVHRRSGSCAKADDEVARTAAATYLDTGIAAGTYYYAVSAIDDFNREGMMSVCCRGVTAPLPPPHNVSASSTDPDFITLTWDSLDGSRYYLIYRSAVSCASSMKKIDSTTFPGYIDSVPTSAVYYYLVVGVDNRGIEGSRSACTQGRVKLLPAPSNVGASCGQYAGGIRLSWDAVEGADGYVIYKGTSNVAARSVALDTVTSLFKFDPLGTASVYYDFDALPRFYYYWVAARNGLGAGTLSGYVYGRSMRPPMLASSNDGDVVTLSWVIDTTVMHINIFRASDESLSVDYYGDGGYFHYQCIDSTTGSSYTDTLPDYAGYYYFISVRTAAGDTGSTFEVAESKPIPAPTGLITTASDSGVFLQWNRLPGIISYVIYRSDSATDTMPYEYSIAYDTSYFDMLTPGDQFHYRIAAMNSLEYGMISESVFGGSEESPQPQGATQRRRKAVRPAPGTPSMGGLSAPPFPYRRSIPFRKGPSPRP